MRLKHDVLLLFFPVLLLTCKKKDTSPLIPPYDLIVEGGINTFTRDQYIRLTKPVLYSGVSPEPINDAIVTVNDGDSDVLFREIQKTGVYTANMENNENYNQAYTLKITYNQKEYTAKDTLFSVFPISDRYIPVSFSVNQSVVKTTIPKHTFGALFAQQWLIMKDKKKWDPSKFNRSYPYSYSHTYGSPNALNPLIQPRTTLTSDIHDSLTVYKFSMSNSRTVFLYNLFQETDWRGILSGTPGNIKGNISGNANGFFYVTDVEMQKKSIADLIKQNQQ